MSRRMDAYISSNSPELSALLARTHITNSDRAEITTPISSPRLAYHQQRRRMPQGNGSVSQARTSPEDTSDYSDSSFERSIANLTFEEIAVLSGKEIVEILTDEDSENEEDTSPASPTILAMEFSCNPTTLARRMMLVESYDGSTDSGPSQPHVTRTEGPPQLSRRLKPAPTSNTSRTNDQAAAPPVNLSRRARAVSSSGGPSTPSRRGSGPPSSATDSAAPSSDSPPPTPPRTPPPAILQDRPLYWVTTPTAGNLIEGWDNAGPRYLTQPQAHCVRVTPRHRPRHNAYPSYTVLKGRITGVFTCPWRELRIYVVGVSHANYKGYDDIAQAQAAYMIGYTLGLVEVVEDDDGTASDTSTAPSSVAPRHPTEEQIYQALERAPNTFMGREWLVVFRGIRPGIYPSWTFVSSMVSGISTSVYEKFNTKEEADARWREAVRARQVVTLRAGVSYVMRA